MNLGLIVIVAFAILPLFIGGFTVVFLLKRSKRGRRSPLTGNLLRSAGESLRNEIERFSEKIDDSLFQLLVVSLPSLLLALLAIKTGRKDVILWGLIFAALLYVALLVWATRRLYRVVKHRSTLYLGLDAELAVGQELNHLMLHGCRVYHDFPAESFNIDHVVVGPGGVFAVETKGRAKPDKGRGSIDATVTYDGQILRFPDWHEKEPLEQARRQADWLQKWLSSAVGEAVTVRSVLALPGWFVDRTQSGNVIVFNGKNPQFLSRPLGKNEPLSHKLVQQIAHQIEQRCRDVAPVGYRKLK